MKISKNSQHGNTDTNNVPVTAATKSGTIFYKAEFQTVKDVLSKVNVWIDYALRGEGFDAIDFKRGMFGSAVIDNILYICQTDGQELNINGTLVDPEEALEKCNIEDLADYIEDATDDIIKSNITEYEIQFNNITALALDMLNDGYEFKEIYEAAEEIGLFEND